LVGGSGSTPCGASRRVVDERAGVFFVPGPRIVSPASVAQAFADIIRDGQIEATVQRCMGERLRADYKRQRAAGNNARRFSQTYVHLVTDVHLTDNGEVWLVGPLRDEHGRFHIDRYDGAGHLIGSLVAPGDEAGGTDDFRFRGLEDVRFAGMDGRRVLSYDGVGNILLAEVVIASP
jgi:hypothetical protein